MIFPKIYQNIIEFTKNANFKIFGNKIAMICIKISKVFSFKYLNRYLQFPEKIISNYFRGDKRVDNLINL